MPSTSPFQDLHPFISCVKINNIEYVGIIINFDHNVTSIYDIGLIKLDDRKKFLDLGETWWWESNRKLPISIFLKKEMQEFKYAIKTFNSKDIEIVFGPSVNLSEIAEKRIKRKSIQLVRVPKSTQD
jgi:hypothetical protein